MEPDVTHVAEKSKASLKNLLIPLKNLLTPVKNIVTALKSLLTTRLKNLLTPLKTLLTPLKNLPIPKKLVIPAIAGAVLITAGGAVFGLLHARLNHAVAHQVKAVASAPVASTTGPATTGPSAACSGVVRTIYRQTRLLSSSVNCAPVPEIAAELKDLTAACRDMVQYTFLGVRDGHPDIKVNDIREKVVHKSVACEHDRPPNIAAVARHRAK